MKCLKLQYKTLVVKLLLLLLFILSVSVVDLCASCKADANNYNLIKLYDSVKICYSNGRYKEAIICLDEIMSIKQKSNIDTFPEYSKMYNSYGIIYKRMGLLDKAVNYYEKTLKYPLSQKNKANVLTNIGNVYTLKGDFNSAIVYFNKVLSIISSSEGDFRLLLADTYYNIGKAYDNSLQYQIALKYSLLSLETREKAGLKRDGETYLNCATNYNKLGNRDTANIYFKKAINCFEKFNGKEHPSTALAYMNYATFLAENKKYSKSFQLYDKSLGILNTSVGNKHLYVSFYYKNLGELYFQLGDYKKALSCYQKSLISKVYDFNDTSIYSNPSSKTFSNIDILEVLTYKALAFEKLAQEENEEKNLLAALKALQLKIDLIERLRSGYLYENTKLKLSENEDDAYMSLIRISTKLLHLTNNFEYAKTAFRYAENSKYAVLREFNNRKKAIKIANIPDSIINKEKSLREQIGVLSQNLNFGYNNSVNDQKFIEFRNELFKLEKELDDLLNFIDNECADLYKFKERNDIVKIEDLKNIIHEDDIMLEYVLDGNDLYTFILTKKEFLFYSCKVNVTFYKSLDFYNRFLHSQTGLDYDLYRKSAYSLYENLLKPYENKLKGKRLIIIPDEEMALMSFEALVDEPPNEKEWVDYGYEPYIIRKYSLGYAFSASLYYASITNSIKGRNKILALAPDYKNSKDSLPITKIPVKYLRKLTKWGGKLFTGEKATETAFKEYVERCNILQLFVHGYEDTLNPALSRMFFADGQDSLNDSYLFNHEINNLNINAKLVVLASCFSGSGKISKGEGVLSLGRGFLNSGANSMVLSLWVASYDPTTKQLDYFRKYLLQGKRKDEALRLAKLKYLEEAPPFASEPRFWSNLIVIGNPEPLYNRGFIFISLFLGIVIIFSVGLRINKKQ